MSATCVEIRQATAARIAALGGDWRASAYPYEVFGADPGSTVHGAYAVGVVRTEALEDRQKVSVGAFVRSIVRIRFTARVKPKDQIASVDTALGMELALVQQLMQETTTWPRTFRPLLRTIERRLLEGGEQILTDIELHAYHHYALQ